MLPKNLRQDAGDSRQDGGSPHPAIEGRGDRMIFSATVIKGLRYHGLGIESRHQDD
ncbi:MAG: hypothetical protein RLZZ282_1623 [Verrucomicrobiota bacterium]